MGKKGSSRHSKRLSAPIPYPIKRKHGVFTIKPYPTRGKAESSIPLGIIMREILGYAKTLSEIKKILVRKVVKIDGKVRTNYKFGVGPMDVIEISPTDEFYRLTPYRGRRRLKLQPISKEEANTKILRVQRKRTIRNNQIQLTFHDGGNYLIDPEEESKIPINEISPKDSVLFNLESKEIEQHIPFAEGNIGLIMGGHNVGIVGKIQDIETQTGKNIRIITLEMEEGEIKTTDNHIFIIGDKKPLIEIPTTDGEKEDES
ncbi:MAG: 30S ribosomal protein S4e [Candidatus Hodarchaeota archaeon]